MPNTHRWRRRDSNVELSRVTRQQSWPSLQFPVLLSDKWRWKVISRGLSIKIHAVKPLFGQFPGTLTYLLTQLHTPCEALRTIPSHVVAAGSISPVRIKRVIALRHRRSRGRLAIAPNLPRPCCTLRDGRRSFWPSIHASRPLTPHDQFHDLSVIMRRVVPAAWRGIEPRGIAFSAVRNSA